MDDVDVPAHLDAVADDPSPGFVGRLEEVLDGQLRAGTARPAAAAEVPLEPLGGRDGAAGHRGRSVLAVAAAVLVAVGGLALLARDPTPQPATPPSTSLGPSPSSTLSVTPSTTTGPGSTVPPTTAAPGTAVTAAPSRASADPVWEPLPDGPLSRRSSPLVVAAGEAVLVVGGTASPAATDGLADRRDGALLDAAAGTWRAIATSPAALGAETPAVWTGSEVVAVDRDGTAWAYAPAADAWRQVATGLGGRLWPTVAFTGAELLVAGGRQASPIGPPDDGVGPAARGAYALDVATGRRRDLPSPGSDDLTGTAIWTGREWVRATGLVDGSLPQPAQQRIGAFDPATGRWRALPGLPRGRSVGAFGLVGDDLIAFDQGSRQWRLPAGAAAWQPEGARPTTGQDSVGRVWVVNGRLVVDTGSNSTNGRFLGYRQASGAWQTLGGLAHTTNDDVIVRLSSGRLVSVTATQAARLRPWVDETEGVAACRRDQLSVGTGDWFGTSEVVLTNRSGSACTVDGQRPATVAFRGVDGRWTEQPVGDLVGLDGRTDGGYLAPGQQALAVVTAWFDPAGAGACAMAGPVDGVRFSLAGGDTLEVDLPSLDGCQDLTAVMSLPASAPSTAGDAPPTCAVGVDVLLSEDVAGFAGGKGFGRALLTNLSGRTCGLPPLLALQQLSAGNEWADVASPSDPRTGEPIAVLGQGQAAEIELSGVVCGDGAPRRSTGERFRLAFGGGGTIEVRAPIFETYGCNRSVSPPVRPRVG